MTAPAHTLSISIDRSPADVIAYAGDPSRLPEWSFLESVEPDGDGWTAVAAGATSRITFTTANAFGVLDHDVTLSDGTVVPVPMRVIPNGTGAEVLITTFERPGVDVSADLDAVRSDLAALKDVLEG